MIFLRRLAFRLLLLTGLVYAGICILLLLGQNRLLYIGTALPVHTAPVALPMFDDAQGAQIGWVAAPIGPARGTLVFFHGNNEQAWQAARSYGPYFTARGWRVVFPEYRGFDFRAGERPTHDTVISDALTAAQRARADWPAGPLWVAGNSLGAGIAAQVARAAGAGRILLFVPWDSMSAVAQERFPFVRTKLLLRADGTDYDSCAALSGLGQRVFIAFAGQDHIIPPRHAINLARCLDVPPGQVFDLADATHLDWYRALEPEDWNILLDAPASRLISPPDRAKRQS
jgi:pimeloyl-ACP methyl ester carboxylesterase